MHKTSVYYKDENGDDTRVMEGETPFSPIGRAKMSYDIIQTLKTMKASFILRLNPTEVPKAKAKAKVKPKARA